MVCIYCSSKTQVTNSRPQKRSGQTWRRHECLKCHAVFTTIEAVDYAGSLRVRTSGAKLMPFNRDKLFLSLYKALGHRNDPANDAAGLTATIIAQLRSKAIDGLLANTDIIRITETALQRFDQAASVQYGAYHKY